jgi:hypothetical protein
MAYAVTTLAGEVQSNRIIGGKGGKPRADMRTSDCKRTKRRTALGRSDRTGVVFRGRRALRRSHVFHLERRHRIVATTIITLIFAHHSVAQREWVQELAPNNRDHLIAISATNYGLLMLHI